MRRESAEIVGHVADEELDEHLTDRPAFVLGFGASARPERRGNPSEEVGVTH